MVHTTIDTVEISYHAVARYMIRFEPEFATDINGEQMFECDVDELAFQYECEPEMKEECNEIKEILRSIVRDAGDMEMVVRRHNNDEDPRYWTGANQMVVIAPDGGIRSIMKPLDGVYNG